MLSEPFMRGLFCLLLLTTSALAQTPDTATLRGEVLDQTGAAVPGVTVTVTNGLTGLSRSAPTDSTGHFSFAGLPIAGSYEVSAAM